MLYRNHSPEDAIIEMARAKVDPAMIIRGVPLQGFEVWNDRQPIWSDVTLRYDFMHFPGFCAVFA